MLWPSSMSRTKMRPSPMSPVRAASITMRTTSSAVLSPTTISIIGRPDIKLEEMGAPINARMGLNTWAAFYGSDADAEIAGDVAMLANEVTPVLKALRGAGLNIVAIHNHMTSGEPTVYFLHY